MAAVSARISGLPPPGGVSLPSQLDLGLGYAGPPPKREAMKEANHLLRALSSLVEEHWCGLDGGERVEEGLHYRIKLNPHLTKAKRKPPNSLARFMDGVKELGLEPFCQGGADVVSAVHAMLEGGHAFLAYHGTSKRSVKGICREGWDPTLRVSNPPDREWFGMRPSVSLYYSTRAKSNEMLVACILKGQHVHSCSWSGTHSVLNDGQRAFCLPLAVVRFSSKPLQSGKWWHRFKAPAFLTLRQ